MNQLQKQRVKTAAKAGSAEKFDKELKILIVQGVTWDDIKAVLQANGASETVMGWFAGIKSSSTAQEELGVLLANQLPAVEAVAPGVSHAEQFEQSAATSAATSSQSSWYMPALLGAVAFIVVIALWAIFGPYVTEIFTGTQVPVVPTPPLVVPTPNAIVTWWITS